MWGQVKYDNGNITPDGIIPTRVGTSDPFTRITTVTRDHPHACGDKNTQTQEYTLSKGSSPRVWGQETAICGDILTDRIIPTRVGTSELGELEIEVQQDHPHACGDKNVFSLYSSNIVGSSPRVWGQASPFFFT